MSLPPPAPEHIFWAYGRLRLFKVVPCHVMFFVGETYPVLGYGWLGYACCPPQPQMMPGMPAFWAPAGPQPRRLTSLARARQKARKPTGKKQGLRSARASHSKSKTDGTTAQRAAQQFLAVFIGFCRARTQHRRHARQRLAPKCAKMSLAYIPLTPSKNQCFMGWEAFWKEVLMMQTKPR